MWRRVTFPRPCACHGQLSANCDWNSQRKSISHSLNWISHSVWSSACDKKRPQNWQLHKSARGLHTALAKSMVVIVNNPSSNFSVTMHVSGNLGRVVEPEAVKPITYLSKLIPPPIRTNSPCNIILLSHSLSLRWTFSVSFLQVPHCMIS
jgi:hypothetical protein